MGGASEPSRCSDAIAPSTLVARSYSNGAGVCNAGSYPLTETAGNFPLAREAAGFPGPGERRRRHAVARFIARGPPMTAFHGTTIDCPASMERDGLWPNSFVSRSRALAGQYAWLRAMTLGADAAVVIELDVPRAAVVDAESWGWASE